MWIWKFFRRIFSYFWKNWDISNRVCNHFLCREGDESSRWCNFTKKNIRHEPKTVYRAPVKHFSQKNFKGPQTPHFADTDLSRLSKKTFFHILVCQNFEFWRLKGICRKTLEDYNKSLQAFYPSKIFHFAVVLASLTEKKMSKFDC